MSLRVVDASVVVKWYVDEFDSEIARELFREADEFAVPDLLFAETASILWKKVRRKEITPEEARDICGYVIDSPFEVYGSRELAGEALRIALEYSITPYDASYVALAARLGVVCATADRKLFEKLRDTAAVKHLSLLADYTH
ncbi:MAG: type II toxin-antitoxin system VapC family toxin [Thermoanaerobaculia bacterium]